MSESSGGRPPASPSTNQADRTVRTSAAAPPSRRNLGLASPSGIPNNKSTFRLLHVSSKPDLESGAEGGERETYVQVRACAEECVPMGSLDRKKEAVGRFLRRRRKQGNPDAGIATLADTDAEHNVTARGPVEAGEKRGIGPFANIQNQANQADIGRNSNESRPKRSGAVSPRDVTTSQMGFDDHFNPTPAPADGIQYTLQARRRIHHGRNIFSRLGAATADYSTYSDHTFSESCCCWPFTLCSISICDPNRLINRFFQWTFRTSFSMLLLAFIVMFFVSTAIFAGLILWAAHGRPQCIASSAFSELIPGYDDGSVSTYSHRAADAYALSWTTFSTVGYGLVYPQVSTEFQEQRRCAAVKFVCSVEAFLGVLFSGLCGAILFAKVSRIQAHAQVIFSDPIVVRYGNGISQDMRDESTVGGDDSIADRSGDGSSSNDAATHWPCPILEFRIMNKLAQTPGGELIDATLNCSASINAEEACPSIRNAVRPHHGRRNKRNRLRKKGHKKSHNRMQTVDSSLYVGMETGAPANDPEQLASLVNDVIREESMRSDTASESEGEDALLNPTSLIQSVKEHQEVIEDASNLVPRRIFSKVHVDPDTHPFFKRVWVVKHTLDEASPLLTKEARALVRASGGFWPEELNNHDAVRSSIAFNTLLVSLSGTCNTNVNTVFIHKTYDIVDICVGYQFANVLFRDRTTGALNVDKRLLNDVTEQYGGGGEPLGTAEEPDAADEDS